MTANSDFSDGLARCGWVDTSPEYIAYHDTEWGFPQGDDRALFEQLCLEGFQSGLSWRTILNKREAFRRGFAGFDPAKVARFDETRIQALLADAGIVRHRGKIEAVLVNARRFLDLVDKEGSFARFVWRFEPDAESRPPAITKAAVCALSTTRESTALSKELRKRGWAFVGPTTAYAFMQSMGLVDDHMEDCWVRADVERERAAFVRPR